MQTTTLYTLHTVVVDERALAQVVADQLLPDNPNGGTYDPRTNRFPRFSGERTYLVSIPGYEYRVLGAPKARGIVGWLKRARKPLATTQHYIGWWPDGETWVLDVSIGLHGDRAFILGLASAWGQKAIYHTASEEVLSVHQIERAA